MSDLRVNIRMQISNRRIKGSIENEVKQYPTKRYTSTYRVIEQEPELRSADNKKGAESLTCFMKVTRRG